MDMYATLTAMDDGRDTFDLYDPAAYADYETNKNDPVTVPRLEGEHRPKRPVIPFPDNMAVARPVGKKEIQHNPAAEKSLKVEWDRLRSINTWAEDKVREWRGVRRELGPGVINHVGRIFEFCVEK